MREELKRLVSLRAPHLMRVRGWYERRVLLDPSANPWGWSAAHEVAVSADLLLGGDLLQRATEQVYCEAHVRTLALTLVRAVETLREAEC